MIGPGSAGWTTRVTAFAVASDGEGRWLLLQHRRVGVVAWEPPGGHLEAAESLEACAARETAEETGVEVDVGRLLATCVHEWAERRQRRLICFFAATPAADTPAPQVPSDDRILAVAWVRPAELARDEVSALIRPLLDAELAGWPTVPLSYRAEHVRFDDGSEGPRLTSA